ncbi:hypothetical protein KAU33_14155 [Candidatus Dependentiae bacterium]|nr:hypothetical protein [Candidatus Dependentiae bacterium]
MRVIKLKNLILLIILSSLVFCLSCQPAEQYVEVNIQTLSTAQRHDINMKIKLIETAIITFEMDNMRKPKNIRELVEKGYIGSEPKDSFGNGFKYDPVKNIVTSDTFQEIEKQKKEPEKNN